VSFWKKKSENEESTSPTVADVPSAPPSGVVATSSSVSAASPGAASKPVVNGAPVASASPAVLPGGALKPEDVLTERFGKARSALGEGTVIQGKLSFDTPVRIDGKLSGEIFSSKVLIVGPSGHIDATIEAACLVILGSVKGTITASERVELWAGASLEGVVTTPLLVIQEGSAFSGTSNMLASQAGYASGPQGQTSRKNPEIDTKQKETSGVQAKSGVEPGSTAKGSGPSGSASSSSSGNKSSGAEAKKEAHVH
jgi:cytoskeletal protein CcmA (bactofilin family)